MKNYLTLDSIDISKKVVGIRVDINSAIINDKVEVSERIVQACQSIQELMNKDATIIIFAHQGRKGKKDFTSLSLHKTALEDILKIKVKFIETIDSKIVQEEIEKTNKKSSQVFLLENLRELDVEQKPELDAKGNVKQNEITKIIELCDYYVLDAFSIAHRAHTSIIGGKKVPHIAGRLLQRELKPLSILEHTNHPKIFVMGGVKPDDLIPLIEKSLGNKTADTILLGGVIGEVALHSQGYNIGKKWNWIVENEYQTSEKILKQLIKKYPQNFILPKDVAYLDSKGKRQEISIDELHKLDTNSEIYIEDIGTQTISTFESAINSSHSCYVKGPVGNFERKGLEVGTYSLFKSIVKSKTFSFMGGGHSVTAAEKSKTISQFSYVSLAGGALVQFLQGKELPGITILEDSYKKFNTKISQHYDMVVVGSNVVDTFVSSPIDLSSEIMGKKIKIEEDFSISVGGGGVNVSCIVSKLKAKVGLITRLSNESVDLLKESSKDNQFTLLSGVVHNQAGSKTVIIETPKQDRVVFTYRGQNQDFSIDDTPKNLPISNYYFSGLSGSAFHTQMKLIKKLKRQQSNTLVGYNPSFYTIEQYGEEISNNLKYIDILIFNKEEAELLTHEKGIKNNLILLSSLGPKYILITDGSKGSYGIDSQSCEIIFVKTPHDAIIVDTTGAGDCYAGTCFYFLTKQYSLERAMELATINANYLIREKGSANGSLTLHELKKKKYNLTK